MPLDTTGLCGDHWNKEPSRTTRNSQRRIREGIEESKVEEEETDDKESTATATMTGSTPTTSQGPQIKHLVETILRQKQDGFVDLAVWNWIGMDSAATFELTLRKPLKRLALTTIAGIIIYLLTRHEVNTFDF